MWRYLIPPLAERHLVVCPDIRGLGRSDPGHDGAAYRLDRLAQDLVNLLDQLGLECVSLVGHDWGTAIGYEACLGWPHRFRRFVALAGIPPWLVRRSPVTLARRLWHIPAIAALGSISIPRLARRALRDWRHVGSFSDEECDAYLAVFRQPEARAATVHFYRNLVVREPMRYLSRSGRRQLMVPTLHLNGRHDHHFQRVPEAEPSQAVDFTFDVLPCGHFVAEEIPQPLLARLLDFLDGA
jgi:pimeloyl-ACP methyl ester carboxylesterase